MQPDFEDLVETFSFLDTWEDRYRHIIDIGKAMPALDAALRSPALKVDGCASQVWLRMHAAPRFHFEGASDALIVSGLIEVLRLLYNGVALDEVLRIDAAAQLARLGLDQHLSAQRSNGLRAMVGKIREFAQKEGKVDMEERYKRVLRKYKEVNSPFTWTFNSLHDFEDAIIHNKHILNMIIFYLFMRVEFAQRKLLVGAMIEKHNIDKDVASETLDDLHMNRLGFVALYETLANKPIDSATVELGEKAQEIRNAIAHGEYAEVDEDEKEEAIDFIFEYSDLLNKQALKDFKFEPFSDLREFDWNTKTDGREESEQKVKKLLAQYKKKKKELEKIKKQRDQENAS